MGVISFRRKGSTLAGKSSRLADHPHIKGIPYTSVMPDPPEWSGFRCLSRPPSLEIVTPEPESRRGEMPIADRLC
jgi:hypothetical protein